jgi:hypothetical protein
LPGRAPCAYFAADGRPTPLDTDRLRRAGRFINGHIMAAGWPITATTLRGRPRPMAPRKILLHVEGEFGPT